MGFFYSIELPSQSVGQRLQEICLAQFHRIYRMMASIELCKVIKFMDWQIWKDPALAHGVIEIFELEADELPYRDIMPVVAVLLNSGIHAPRVKRLIVKLM